MVLRPGMVFRPRVNVTDDPDFDSGAKICVANMDWAVLAWPLVLKEDDNLELDVQGKLEWHFVFRLNQFEAAVAEPVLDNRSDQIIVKSIENWQPAGQCCLGNYSTDLVFRDLVSIADLGCKIPKAKSHARADLIRKIALEVSGGDAAFVEDVMANEALTKKKMKPSMKKMQQMKLLLKCCWTTWTRKMRLTSNGT